MAAATGRVDEFVKDYLAFRGLSTTLRSLEYELKNEREKGFRVDKMVEQLQLYIGTYDLTNLRDYWNFLNSRLFCRLEQRFMTSVRKLEVGLLKLYLVNAAQKNKPDRIREFFEKLTDVLQNQPEFKEWFAFPFIRNPEENSHYSIYFTPQWQDTFYLSLHNFLSVILQAMPVPVLLNFESELKNLRELQEENERLKQQLVSLGEKPDADWKSYRKENSFEEGRHMELMYDFSALGEDTVIPDSTPANKSPRKFPFSSSPLSIGKKNENKGAIAKKKDDQFRMGKMTNKDSHSRPASSSLLPIITRQKKVKVHTGSLQSTDSFPTHSMSVCEPSGSGLKLSELATTAQKMKKMDGAKQERRELFEGKEKLKDDATPQHVAFTRSVSEPATEIMRKKLSYSHSRRVASKSILEGPTEHCGKMTEPGDNGGETLPMATTAMPQEMHSFPPLNTSSDESSLNSVTMETVQPPLEAVNEKPFFVLGQDEYAEHRSAVSYARFSTSGQYIGSVDVDGVVKVWSWSPQANTAATVMSKSAFLSLEWASKSDRWLLLGNRSGNIRLFDVKEMKSFYEASGDPSYPRIISLCANPASPQFVCSATTGRVRTGSFGPDTGPGGGKKTGKLSIWDLKTMKAERQLPLEPGPVCINSCVFNHNGNVLLTGGVDGYIRIYDIGQQRCISQFEAHTTEIKNVMFSADYTSCYSLGADGKLIEWSMNKHSHKLRELPVMYRPNTDGGTYEDGSNKETPAGQLLAIDPDGGYMLTFDKSNTLVYKMIKEDPGLVHLMNLKGQRSTSSITTVDWSPNVDTKVCLTGYTDGRIIVSTLLSQ